MIVKLLKWIHMAIISLTFDSKKSNVKKIIELNWFLEKIAIELTASIRCMTLNHQRLLTRVQMHFQVQFYNNRPNIMNKLAYIGSFKFFIVGPLGLYWTPADSLEEQWDTERIFNFYIVTWKCRGIANTTG